MYQTTIPQRTLAFSKRLLRSFRIKINDQAGRIISNQILRSATSIGANVIEAQYASSKREFLRYYQIALRSCRETEYWLQLCQEIEVLDKKHLADLDKENIEIAKILMSSIMKGKGLR